MQTESTENYLLKWDRPRGLVNAWRYAGQTDRRWGDRLWRRGVSNETPDVNNQRRRLSWNILMLGYYVETLQPTCILLRVKNEAVPPYDVTQYVCANGIDPVSVWNSLDESWANITSEIISDLHQQGTDGVTTIYGNVDKQANTTWSLEVRMRLREDLGEATHSSPSTSLIFASRKRVAYVVKIAETTYIQNTIKQKFARWLSIW